MHLTDFYQDKIVFWFCLVGLFPFYCQGKTSEFLEEKYFFLLSDGLSELIYCIHFVTLMANRMFPAVTIFKLPLFFGRL